MWIHSSNKKKKRERNAGGTTNTPKRLKDAFNERVGKKKKGKIDWEQSQPSNLTP